ncbi:hypothetical protein [Aestuariirhabdus sp. LZHN29]|uniref:hypothetical protein n=1 Tax=Aestuariirhabdus sp. LZHN29 TaxID=3417462 RepID=UPI003CF431B4
MKRIFLLCLTSLLITACSSQQTDSSSTMAAEPATTPQTTAPAPAPEPTPEPAPTPEPMNEMTDLDKLWERYCNHEALTTMERQEIADSEMPARFKGSCTQK